MIAIGLVAGCTVAIEEHSGMEVVSASSKMAQTNARHVLAHTRLQLAAMHFEEGRFEIALAEVAQALQAHPQYVDAYNLQGWIHLGQNHYTEADASFAQALVIQPNAPDTRYNLGWSQCQQKHFPQADAHFDAALASSRPAAIGKARIWLAKGVCLRDAGQVDAALKALKQAYELALDSPLVAYTYAELLSRQGDEDNILRTRMVLHSLNRSQQANAASLWLGIKVEHRLGETQVMNQLAIQLRKLFPESKELHWYEQGAFNE